MATVAKGYDLDYAWRAVGEAYRGAGYYLAAAEAGEPPGAWWGPGTERLGLTQGLQVEREPYNLLFGERKGPDGQKLGRAPANAGKAVEIYQGLLAADPVLAGVDRFLPSAHLLAGYPAGVRHSGGLCRGVPGRRVG